MLDPDTFCPLFFHSLSWWGMSFKWFSVEIRHLKNRFPRKAMNTTSTAALLLQSFWKIWAVVHLCYNNIDSSTLSPYLHANERQHQDKTMLTRCWQMDDETQIHFGPSGWGNQHSTQTVGCIDWGMFSFLTTLRTLIFTAWWQSLSPLTQLFGVLWIRNVFV